MKATEIIRAALTRLGVYATGEEVPADDALAALAVLNGLLSEYKLQPLLKLDSLMLPLSITDDVILSGNLQRVVILGLALDLAPDYGVKPALSLIRQHSRAITTAKHANAKPITTKSVWRHHRCGYY